MANINVTYTENTITVNEITSNITVTETVNEITVGESTATSTNDIRASLGNVSPILYNASAGIFSFDSNATFTGKTTTDLAEGTNLYFTAARARGNVSATTASGISYNSSTGVFSLASIPNSSLTSSAITINGTSVSLGGTRTLTTTDIAEGTNLYFTAARARGNVSAANTTTGHGNISYNNSTGVITYDRVTPANILSEVTAGNVKLKQYSETVFDAGNQFGNVTLDVANGSIQQLNLVGNVTGLAFTNITAGSTVSLILRQDAIGFRRLNTISFASNWTTWDFVGDHTTLTIDPLAYDILTVTYNGTNYFASLVNFDQPVIQNSQLANSNVVVNGVTIALGSSGNIDTFNSNVTVNGNLNVTGNLNYQNVTDLYVTDQKITLNSNAAINSNVEIISNRPTATNTMLKWNEPSTRWEFTNDGTTYYAIATSTTDLAEGSNLWFTTARANSAIDTRVNKAFVDGLGVEYSSLANAPTNVSFFTNDAGYLVAANLASLTANVDSVNGATGIVVLDTDDIAEGSANLYYSNARVNAFIQDNITTSDIDEGTNLYYTTDRANTAIGAYQGSINTPGNITAGNVITTNIHTNGGTSLVLNSNTSVVVKETIKGVSTNVGNISGDGYAYFVGAATAGTVVVNVNAGNLDAYYFTTGNATAGSNVITGASIALVIGQAANVSANLNVVTPYYTINPFGASIQDPFPPGTYVTSVDAANSTITMNNPAANSRDLSVSFTGGGIPFNRSVLLPGIYDANTGYLAGLLSQATAIPTGAGSRTLILGQSIYTPGVYGYPATGPAPTDFVYAIGNSSNYSQGTIPATRFIARSKLEAPRTVLQAPRGLIVGNGDLTIRAENDTLPSFGINVLWDGLGDVNNDYAGIAPITQILLKQYSSNSAAVGAAVSSGPRIFFTAARGNKNQSYLETYPRANDEMGRITWWGPTQYQPAPSTPNAPAWISGVAGQDFVDTNSGMGMYFANSPNTTNSDRSLYLASTKGATLIASAADSTNTHQPVIFAPSHLLPFGANNGNSVWLYNQTVNGTEAETLIPTSGAHFAQINYANTSGLTGARIAVTNGNNFATEHEGNIALSLDRNSNTANVKVAARVGFVNYLGSSNPDRVRFDFAAEGLANATPVTISGFTNVTVAGALNGNVFFVKGPFINGSFREYELYTDSGLTTGVNLGVANINAGPGVFEYTRTNSVTAKDWSFVLAQGSNNLVIAEDGVTRTTFADANITTAGNITASTFLGNVNGTTATLSGNADVTGNVNLGTNATINYDAVYGCFHNMANVTAANADTVYQFAWPNVHINTNRVTVASNTQITIGQEGAYNFALEMQAENTDNQDRTAFIWLAKNGTDIDETCVRVSLLKEWKQVIVKEWIVNGLAANDYIEVRFAVDNPSGVQLTALPAQASPYLRPAVPSAVITVTPVGA